MLVSNQLPRPRDDDYLNLLCHACGRRLGQHRFATDQCPNLLWKVGNGQPHWQVGCFTRDGAKW